MPTAIDERISAAETGKTARENARTATTMARRLVIWPDYPPGIVTVK
jgi:hypothetical protein